MKILFCTDGSKISYNSIENFSNMFNSVNADIISVSDMTYLPDNFAIETNQYVQQCTNSTSAILEHSKIYLENLGINVRQLIKLCGSATDAILDVELNEDYDYIVMGSNGKKGIQKWLGSVSQEVASNSKTSVYISKSTQNANEVLFPVTLSNLSINGVKKTIKNMNLVGSNIHLLNVYQIPDFLFLEGNMDSNWATDLEIKQQNEADKILNSIEKLFIDKGINIVDKVTKRGITHEEILKYINQNSISLVVTGMREHKTFSGIVFSSVSRRILEDAPCDVLIYKDI